MLFEMVTKNPAKLAGFARVLGEITKGAKADLMVIGGDRTKPYDALLGATPKAVRLVIVGGKAVYGEAGLQPVAEAASSCDAVNVCGVGKFVCGLQTTDAGNKYDAIKAKIATELAKYDDAHP